MTRVSRESGLSVALAWSVASEAVEAAELGSVEQSTLMAEEALLSKALDRVAERINVDPGDLVREAIVSLTAALTDAAAAWERSERQAVEAAERRAMVRAGLLEPRA